MKVKNPTVGSDVEVFLRDKTTAEIVSAEGIAQGTKHRPFVFDKSDKNFATSLDNVLFEFGIPPATSLEGFLNGLQRSLNYINSVIPSNLCTAHVASAFLDERFLQTENAQTFGCEPDINAWTRSFNPRPESNTNLRSSGFHVHFGYDNPEDPINEEIIKACDLYLGLPSLLIDPDEDRRKLYGKAGAFRQKPYGCEYRTLSGYFASSQELMAFVYNGAMQAIKFVNSFKEIDDLVGEQIQTAINECNKDLAKSLIKQFRVPML